MSISERISDAINAIKALSAQNGGGRDTTKIDSDEECQRLSGLLARTDIELTQEERDVILGLKVEYKSNKIHSQQTEPPVNPSDPSGEPLSDVALGKIQVAGEDVRDALTGSTDDDKRDMVSDTLDKVNKDNVLAFLDGYYKEGKGRISGLMKKLDRRGRSKRTEGSRITMEQKVELLQAVLAKAKECGLEGETEYIRIENILKKYVKTVKTNDGDEILIKDGKAVIKDGNTKFNKNATKSGVWEYKHGKGLKSHLYSVGGAAVGVGIVGIAAAVKAGALTGSCFAPGLGTIIGAVGGLVAGYIGTRLIDHNTDNEILDDNLEALYEKMGGSSGE